MEITGLPGCFAHSKNADFSIIYLFEENANFQSIFIIVESI